MRKSGRILGLILVFMMVLSQSGTVLSYFDVGNVSGPAYAEDAEDNENSEAAEDRSLEVTAEREILYTKDSRGEVHWTDPVRSAEKFWMSLADRKANLQKEDADDTVTVVIEGKLPEDVKAEAKYIEFDEADQYDAGSESALFALNIKLVFGDGSSYIPEEPVTVRLKGDSIKSYAGNNDTFTLYSYEENQERAESTESVSYAADVLVLRDAEADRIAQKSGETAEKLYEVYDKNKDYGEGADAVRYTESEDGLRVTDEDEVEFTYAYGTSLNKEADADAAETESAQFVLSAKKRSAETDNRSVTKAGKITASDGNTYSIKVSYDAAAGIPENAELKVEEITENDSDYDAYVDASAEKLRENAEKFTFVRAFDIKIVDPETGEEYQPESGVSVSIDLLDQDIDKDASVSVVHFDEPAKKEEISAEQTTVMDSDVNRKGVVEFTADGFSVYVIIGHEGGTAVTNPRVEFHFLSDEFETADADTGTYKAGFYEFINTGLTTQSSQILKNGESLEMIANPKDKTEGTNKKYFYGWYAVTKTGTTDDNKIKYQWTADPDKMSFETNLTISGSKTVNGEITWKIGDVEGTATLDAEGTAHVYLAPIYEDYYFVNFHAGQSTTSLGNTISTRKLAVLGSDNKAVVNIGAIKATNADSDKKVFAGWRSTGGVHDVSFPSVNPETGQEVTATVWAKNGEAYSDPKESGYYIVLESGDFPETTSAQDNSVIRSYDLYPIFAEARWIHFPRNGSNSTYVPSQYLLTSDDVSDTYYVTSLPKSGKQPSYNGYTFSGWYADAEVDTTTGCITNPPVEGGDNTGKAVPITDADGNVRNIDYVKTDGENKLYEIKSVEGGTCGKLFVYKNLDVLNLSAHWVEITDTTIQVNVWKQKVTDDKNASDNAKKYDYSRDDSYSVAANSNWDLTAARSNGVLASAESLNEQGFSYRTTTMSTDKVSGDGTTVVNVYYDRDLITFNFNTYTNDYTYTETTGNSTPQYAFINGEWVELARKSTRGYKWTAQATYNHTDSDTESVQYGLVKGEYVKLTSVKQEGSHYILSVYDPDYYPSEYYDQEYEGTTIYTATSYDWWGNVNGAAVYRGTPSHDDNNIYYYRKTNWWGTSYERLYWREVTSTYYTFQYNGTDYTGLRFLQDGAADYSGEVYTRSGSEAPYTYTEISDDDQDNDPVKYGVDSYGGHIPLTGAEVDIYTWVVPEYGDIYTLDNTDGTYGLVDGEYVELTPVTEPGTAPVEVYTPVSGAPSSGNDYLIVSRNTVGSGYALSYDTSGVATDAVTVNSNGETVYISTGDVNSTSIWSVNQNGDYFYLNNQSAYICHDRGTLDISSGEYYWQWSSGFYYYGGGNGSTKRYISYKTNNGFTLNNNSSSVYLFEKSTVTMETEIITGYTYNGTAYTGDRYTKSYGPTENSVEYTGTRYTRSNSTSNGWHLKYQYTGLYGQTLQQCGYTWPSEYDWYDNTSGSSPTGTRTTFLDAFLPTDDKETLNFYGKTAASSSSSVIFYKQDLDDTTQYTEANRVGTSGNSSFNISDKYTGFTAYQYRVDGGSWTNVGEKSSSTGYYGSAVSYSSTLEIRFKRDTQKLVFNVNYPNVAGLVYPDGQDANKDVEGIYYEQSLANYGEGGSDYWVPKGPSHYVFMGWFEDAAGSTAFDFNSTMPSADKIIYGYWKAEEVLIQIDPNGGEIDHINHGYDNDAYDNNPAKKGYFKYWWADAEKTDGGVYKSGVYDYAPFATFNRSGDQASDYDNKSTYVNAAYNETIEPYDMENCRQYVEITEAEASNIEESGGDTYYYLNTQYKDTDGSSLPKDLRNALYLKESELEKYHQFYSDWIKGNLLGGYITDTEILSFNNWKDTYLKKDARGNFQKYREKHDNETYTFLGWYKINYDSEGNEIGPDSMPYNPDDPVTGPMTLRAYWRLDGNYHIEYISTYTDDAVVLEGDMPSWRDPDNEQTTYADGSQTNIYRQPSNVTADGSLEDGENYIFRGWQLVSSRTVSGQQVYTPLEDNVYYDPGDPFTVSAGYADANGVIRFQAVYEKISDSYRRPDVAALTLNANTGFITEDGTTELSGDSVMSWDGNGSICLDGDRDELVFGYYNNSTDHFQTGRAVHLYKYASTLTKDAAGNALDPSGTNYFKHNEGYKLLGFDDAANENDYIATYMADSVISLQRSDNKTIYAVWEPMVYVNIVNDTDKAQNFDGGNVTFGISSTDDTALYVVNQVTGEHERVSVADLSNMTVAAGQSLTIAVPKGKGKNITLSGTNTLGTGMFLTWQGELNGVTEGHPSGEQENGKQFTITDTMVEDETGITITFGARKADYTLEFDENYSGGSKSEVYYTNNESDSNYVQNADTLPLPSTRIGYEFLGWAQTKAKADAGTVDYSVDDRAIANIYNTFFAPTAGLDTDNNQIVTLYAAWKVKGEAQTVYVYKNVPSPGDQTKPFSFSLACSARYQPYNQSASEQNYSGTFELTHNQYLKIVTERKTGINSSKAYVQSVVTKYKVVDGGDDEVISTQTFRKEWNDTHTTQYGTNLSFNLTVTENDYQSDYYDTDLEAASVTESEIQKDTDETSQTYKRKVSWDNPDTGGTVIFTNTRQTVDVTVAKTLEGTNASGIFNFEASYKTPEEPNTAVDLDDFTVTSGSDGYLLTQIPAGSVLTVTEKGTNLLDYETTAAAENAELDGSIDRSSDTSGDVVTYKRSVTTKALPKPSSDDKKAKIIFTNTLKSVPIKIIKRGFDGTNIYNDVEAAFKLYSGASNFFGATAIRYTDGNTGKDVIYDTGRTFSGVEDPELYVGSYILEETNVYGNYMKLDDVVPFTVKGTENGVSVELGDEVKGAKVIGIGFGSSRKYYITVINRKTGNLTVQKGLLDPMVNQRVFSFSGSYTLDGEVYTFDNNGEYGEQITDGTAKNETIDSFDLTAYATSDGSVSNAEQPAVFKIPIGAKDLVISEDTAKATSSTDTIATTYDTQVQINNGSRETASSHSYSTFTNDNAGDVLTFYNIKKTVDVDVSKIVDKDDTSGKFAFTATLMKANGDRIGAYPIYIAGDKTDESKWQYTQTEGDLAGKYGFVLENNNDRILTIPVGAKLSIHETGVSENNSGNTMDAYSTTVGATYTSGGGSFTGETEYSDADRLYTIKSSPGSGITVTFTNGDGKFRNVILRKVNTSYAPKTEKSFKVYRVGNESAVRVKQDDGSYRTLENLTSDSSGAFYIGKLSYGDYVIEESSPNKWYYLLVNDKGVYTSEDGLGRNSVAGGYSTRADAEAALATAKEKYK